MSYTAGACVNEVQKVVRECDGAIAHNTLKAYDTKAAEFFSFCDQQYKHEDYPRTITEAKVFIFIYYQAFREHKKRGKRKSLNSDECQDLFDIEDFKRVTGEYNSDPMGEGKSPQLYSMENARKMTGQKLIGQSVIAQYLAAIKKEWQRQVDLNANNVTLQQLMSGRVMELKNLVHGRKAKVKKANYGRKIDHAVSPNLLIGKPESLLRDASVETVLPALHAKLDQLQSAINARFYQIQSQLKGLETQINGHTCHQACIQNFVHHLTSFEKFALPALNTVPPSSRESRNEVSRASIPVSHLVSTTAPVYEPSRKYSSVTAMYNEWYGLGTLHSQGGIAMMEATNKKWRKNFDPATQKRFSRMRFIVHQVKRLEADKGCTSGQALFVMDALFQQEKKSVAKLESLLKSMQSYHHIQIPAGEVLKAMELPQN